MSPPATIFSRWWWWCGHNVTRRCLFICAHTCQLTKWASASAQAPSAGLSSRQHPYACSLRRQVPGVRGTNLTQPQVEEKDCEARPPHHPPTPSEEGVRNLFHLLGVGCPWTGILCKETPGRVFLVSRTLLPILPLVSEGRPGVINCIFPPPLPTLGKDHGENAW